MLNGGVSVTVSQMEERLRAVRHQSGLAVYCSCLIGEPLFGT